MEILEQLNQKHEKLLSELQKLQPVITNIQIELIKVEAQIELLNEIDSKDVE